MLSALIQVGLSLLREDIPNSPSVDECSKYEDKNIYFRRSNEIGIRLMRVRDYWESERYFKAMLEEVLKYEEENSRRYNKGMVYANLGISQIANEKIDLGIANLLTAEEEDQSITGGEFDILETTLWSQFEHRAANVFFNEAHLFHPVEFEISRDEILTPFYWMQREERIFLEGLLLDLEKNLRQNGVCSNVFTRARLYSDLKDICLLVESLLRKKQRLVGTSIEQTKTLWWLLKNALSSDFPQIDETLQELGRSVDSLQELVNKLDEVLGKQGDFTVQRACCLYLIRNFTGHHFDVSDTVTSPNGRTFFDMYELVLGAIFSLILYFRHIQAL